MASVSKRKWTHNGAEKEAWAVRYLDRSGVHRQRTFDLKKQADAFRRKVTEELESGTHIARGEGGLIRDLASDFLTYQEDRWKDKRIGRGTYENYTSAVDHHIVKFLGNRRLHELTPQDVENWYRQLTREGMATAGFGARKKKGLSPVTARGTVNALSNMFEWAIARGFAKLNPCRTALKGIGGVTREIVRTFQPEQIVRLLKAAETRPRHAHRRPCLLTRCAVHLAAFCGLRFGEIFALTVGSINLDSGYIAVRSSLSDWDEIKTPKTKAGVRDVPMPPHVILMMREWIENEYVPNDRGLLFRATERLKLDSPKAGYIAGGTFRKHYWWPLLERAGLADSKDRFHFHALRHFAASWWIDSGLPLTEVAGLLGHRKFDMTLQVYAHPIVNGHRRAAVFETMAARLIDAPTTLDVTPLTHGMRNDQQAIDNA